jgi:hypothetical protein
LNQNEILSRLRELFAANLAGGILHEFLPLHNQLLWVAITCMPNTSSKIEYKAQEKE